MPETQSSISKECACCGERDNLTFCSKCEVYFCGFCFGWTSSHEPNCEVIFNEHHPNLNEEIEFYKKDMESKIIV